MFRDERWVQGEKQATFSECQGRCPQGFRVGLKSHLNSSRRSCYGTANSFADGIYLGLLEGIVQG